MILFWGYYSNNCVFSKEVNWEYFSQKCTLVLKYS